jgi:hypothetical protein
MTISKIYEFKGLNLRQNDVVRDPRYASDVENVVFDAQKQIRKRNGYDEDVDFLSSVGDLIRYRRGGELLAVGPLSLLRKNGAGFDTINFGGDVPTSGWSGYIDYVEYNGVIYITDPSETLEMMKYDGYNVYRAGVPLPSATISVGSGTFYRIALGFIDAQMNVIWGDYEQLEAGALATITFDTMLGTEFYSKFANSDAAEDISSVFLTKSVSSHNFLAGDCVVTYDNAGVIVRLIVESVTPTSITFTAASVGTSTISYGAVGPLERRHIFSIFTSANATYGYERNVETIYNPTGATYSYTVGASPTVSVPMEDVYDTTVVRGLPPKCKYISVFGSSIVIGHRSGERQSGDVDDLSKSTLFWSLPNTGYGTSIENFAPFDSDIIGQTSEGEISGFFESSDSLIVFKESQVYYLSGVLTGFQYRKRNALANKIGCVSHKSIVEFSGGCLFMSEKGVFYTSGSSDPKEMSDLIEPLFTENTVGYDLTKAYSDLDVKRELIYFYIPATLPANDVVVVYDFYYEEWLVFKNIKARAGLTVFNDKLYHLDGQVLFSESNGFQDAGSNISALYATGWENASDPAKRKKFIRGIISSVGSVSTKINLVTQVDWNSSLNDTDESKDFSSTVHIDDISLNTGKYYCLRSIFKNSRNEDMLITGYELEIEPVQKKAKGED